ncbi:unnamed protein product, partial [Ilex paraguariensis]
MMNSSKPLSRCEIIGRSCSGPVFVLKRNATIETTQGQSLLQVTCIEKEGPPRTIAMELACIELQPRIRKTLFCHHFAAYHNPYCFVPFGSNGQREEEGKSETDEDVDIGPGFSSMSEIEDDGSDNEAARSPAAVAEQSEAAGAKYDDEGPDTDEELSFGGHGQSVAEAS